MSNREDLLSIIRAYLKKQKYEYEEIDFVSVLKLAESLRVGNIVLYELKKSGYHYDLIDKHLYSSMIKYEKYNREKERISLLLNKNSIKHLYVKGLSMARHYDETYLRDFTDLDVVVQKQAHSKASSLLVNELKYKYYKRMIHEDEMSTVDNLNVDLHRTFLFDDEDSELIFSDCFNENHELDINHEYLFLLMHCLKHFKEGVLDLRFFIDLYYLRSLINNNIVDDLLIEAKITVFNSKMNSYLDCLLGNKEYDEIDKNIEDFIFSYGLDSGAKNKVLINRISKNRISYYLERLFPSYKLMKYEYPILNKIALLLPVYYVVRIIKIVFSNRGEYAFNEMLNNSKVNDEDIKIMRKIVDDLSIDLNE